MKIFQVEQIKNKLPEIIDQTVLTHEPVLITSKKNNAVVISEQDWEDIQETLHILSVSGMREKIKSGLETPLENCTEKIDW